MTAPLPPPDIIDANYGNLYTERKVKLAVREALERAATIIEQGWVEQRKLGMSDAIRALLKEYSNE